MNDIEAIFNLLGDWYKFPKYQLERRLDIFFALYLPEILKNSELKIDITHEDIIPEFPLKKDGKTKKGKETNASDNADYAVFQEIKKGKRKLYLIELKTDMNSINKEDQIEYYENIQNKNLEDVLLDIRKIYNGSAQWEKYGNLLEYMEEKLSIVKGEEAKKGKRENWKKWEVIGENISKDKIEVIYLIPICNEGIKLPKSNNNRQIKTITFKDVREAIKYEQDSVSEYFCSILEKIENEAWARNGENKSESKNLKRNKPNRRSIY